MKQNDQTCACSTGCQRFGDDVDQACRKVSEKHRSKGRRIERKRLKGLKKRKLVGNVETVRTKNITVRLTRRWVLAGELPSASIFERERNIASKEAWDIGGANNLALKVNFVIS